MPLLSLVSCILNTTIFKYIYTYIYTPVQKYKTTLKNEEKDIVYNF